MAPGELLVCRATHATCSARPATSTRTQVFCVAPIALSCCVSICCKGWPQMSRTWVQMVLKVQGSLPAGSLSRARPSHLPPLASTESSLPRLPWTPRAVPSSSHSAADRDMQLSHTPSSPAGSPPKSQLPAHSSLPVGPLQAAACAHSPTAASPAANTVRSSVERTTAASVRSPVHAQVSSPAAESPQPWSHQASGLINMEDSDEDLLEVFGIPGELVQATASALTAFCTMCRACMSTGLWPGL
jgi:hypothetical protein